MGKKIFVEMDPEVLRADAELDAFEPPADFEEFEKTVAVPPIFAATFGIDADSYWREQENGLRRQPGLWAVGDALGLGRRAEAQLEACERDVEYVDDDPIGDQAPPGYDETDFREDK